MSLLKPKELVFDIEIEKSVDGKNITWADKDKMGISVIGVYDYYDDNWEVYCYDNLKVLEKMFSERDIIVSWNGINFDIPVMEHYGNFANAGCKHVDLMAEVKKRYVGRPPKGALKLDSVAENTLGIKKSGDGALAPVLWQNKQYGELFSYCLRDVKLTKELYEFIKRYKYCITGDNKRILF